MTISKKKDSKDVKTKKNVIDKNLRPKIDKNKAVKKKSSRQIIIEDFLTFIQKKKNNSKAQDYECIKIEDIKNIKDNDDKIGANYHVSHNTRMFFTTILGIDKDWIIKSVLKNDEIREIIFLLELNEKVFWLDPKNIDKKPHIHKWKTKTWRDIDIRGYKVTITAKVPQLQYINRDGTKYCEDIFVPWAEPFSRITNDFKKYALELLQSTKCVSQTASITKLSWHTINNLMIDAIKKTKKDVSAPKKIAIDEKAISKGHKYATIIIDQDNQRVLEVSKGRSAKSVKKVFKTLTKTQKENVEIISMDMWPAYINESKNQLPNAICAFDKFHLLAHLNQAIDSIRRKENKTLILENNEILKNTKYLFLRNQENLKKNQKPILKNTNLKTVQAYLLKEEFRNLFNIKSSKEATLFLKKWCDQAILLNDKNLLKFVSLVKNHIEGIINNVITKVNNAIAESFNSIIQLIKYSARGIKSFKNFRFRVLFFCRYNHIT